MKWRNSRWIIFDVERFFPQKPLTVYCAPGWNHLWFKKKFTNEPIPNNIIHILKEVYKRQSGRCQYRFVGNKLYIYDNHSINPIFNYPKEDNVTYKVFDVLLDKQPEALRS